MSSDQHSGQHRESRYPVMATRTFFLADESATVAMGERIGHCVQAGMVVFLEGTLGAGKTTTTRGILQALGHSGAVKSPTYTLVEPYENVSPLLYHFDLYRLGDPEELDYMGIREYFSAEPISVVEWSERGQGYLPEPDISLCLSPQQDAASQVMGRELTILAHNASGQRVIDHV